jgi:predicted RNase H-like HicB family nuclease
MVRRRRVNENCVDRLDRDFEPSVESKAKKIAAGYRVILDKNDGDDFTGTSVELPTVLASGRTPDECYEATQTALVVTVATMIEMGEKPPMPSSTNKRTVQINIKLTAEEKVLLSGAARSLGYKGLSDFLRRAALREIGATR